MSSDAQILAPDRRRPSQADPRRWLTLVILLLAGFMNLLDVSIVNIAIPSIQRDLHASYADVQWALAGYTLAYALVLITGGRLGDTFGRKRLFLIGVAGFTIMSALCGAATSPGMLIGCRVAQGAMGAHHGAPGAGGHPGHLPAPGADQGAGGLRRDGRARHGQRAAARRPAHPAQPVRAGLAADLPHQRPGRRDRLRRVRGPGPRVEGGQPAPAGPGRGRADLGGPAAPAVPAGGGAPARLAALDVRVDGPLRAGCWPRSSGTSGSRAAATARRWCRSACSPTARSARAWAWPSRSSSASPHSPWCSPCSCSSAWGSARCTPG